jgi:hypothetical protein
MSVCQQARSDGVSCFWIRLTADLRSIKRWSMIMLENFVTNFRASQRA